MKKLFETAKTLGVGVLAALCLVIMIFILMYFDQQINDPKELGAYRVMIVGFGLITWSMPVLALIGFGSLIQKFRGR